MKEDFNRQLKRYYNNIKKMFEYTSRRTTGIKTFRSDIINQIIGTEPKIFIVGMRDIPNIYIKKIEKSFEKLESDLEEFQYQMDEAWQRVLIGSKEDMLYDNEDDETDPETVDDYDVFDYFDKSHFVTYAAEEIGHNVKGRYPIWDKYIEPDFNYSKLNDVYQSEDVWSPIEEAVEDLIEELESLKKWLLARLRLIQKDININKRGYIMWIFTTDDIQDWYDWIEIKEVWNKYE